MLYRLFVFFCWVWSILAVLFILLVLIACAGLKIAELQYLFR